jgi:hypothetical protein
MRIAVCRSMIGQAERCVGRLLVEGVGCVIERMKSYCLDVTEKMVMIRRQHGERFTGPLLPQRRDARAVVAGNRRSSCGSHHPAQRSLGVVRPVASRVVEFAADSTRRHATHSGDITHEQQPASRTEQRRETLLTAVANSVIRSASKGGIGKINARSPSRTRVARGTAEAIRQHDERDRAAKHVGELFRLGHRENTYLQIIIAILRYGELPQGQCRGPARK